MMWLLRPTSSGLEDTYRVGSLRGRRRPRRRVRIGAPGRALTPVAGMLAVTELVERLDMIGRLDAAIGPIKQRRRGHTAGQVLVGFAAAQLAGKTSWSGWTANGPIPPGSSWRRCPTW